MASAVDFKGSNVALAAPEGRDDVYPLKAFTNGTLCVTCWELTEPEIFEIQKTGRVWLSLMFGKTMPPALIASEQEIRSHCVDYGGAFPQQETEPLSQADLHNRLAGRINASIIKPILESGGDFADVLVLLESIIFGVILTSTKLGGDEAVLDAIVQRVKERLAKERLGNLSTAGQA